MSFTRIAGQIAGFLALFFVVIAGYNYAAYLVVQNVISQSKNLPPFPTATELETSFEIGDFKGLDGIIYKPERDHFGNR